MSGPSCTPVRAERGTALSCRAWPQEAARRMLHNNLDRDVAEHPESLVVYGGTGRAARDWKSFAAIEAAPGADELARVLTNGPGTGIIRHADAGYEIAEDVARRRGVHIPRREA